MKLADVGVGLCQAGDGSNTGGLQGSGVSVPDEGVAQELSAAGFATSIDVREGRAKDMILAAAAEWQPAARRVLFADAATA